MQKGEKKEKIACSLEMIGNKLKTWRCEMYADVLLEYPCLTFHIKAVDLKEATTTMQTELKNIQVVLRPGVMTEELNSRVRFEENERIRITRYVPDQRFLDKPFDEGYA
jgi:hypothetical protein